MGVIQITYCSIITSKFLNLIMKIDICDCYFITFKIVTLNRN